MISPVKIWRNQKKIQSLLGKTGTIISWTRIHVPPAGFSDHAPYVVVIVQWETGGAYMAQLVDCTDAHIRVGQRVTAILRRTRDPGEEDVIPYGIKFKPID